MPTAETLPHARHDIGGQWQDSGSRGESRSPARPTTCSAPSPTAVRRRRGPPWPRPEGPSTPPPGPRSPPACGSAARTGRPARAPQGRTDHSAGARERETACRGGPRGRRHHPQAPLPRGAFPHRPRQGRGSAARYVLDDTVRSRRRRRCDRAVELTGHPLGAVLRTHPGRRLHRGHEDVGADRSGQRSAERDHRRHFEPGSGRVQRLYRERQRRGSGVRLLPGCRRGQLHRLHRGRPRDYGTGHPER